MKLAIFFIIVGISSCFVDADHKLDCALKMDHGQAQGIVAQLVQVLALSHNIKDITDECGIRSCWESIQFLIKLIAAATNCPYDAICWTVVTNLPQSYSAQAKEIQGALSAGTWDLLIINVEVTVLAETCTDTVRILLPAHGHNCDDLAGDAVMSLGSIIPEIVKVVNSLKSCGINVGITVNTVGGVTTLISKTGCFISNTLGVAGVLGGLTELAGAGLGSLLGRLTGALPI